MWHLFTIITNWIGFSDKKNVQNEQKHENITVFAATVNEVIFDSENRFRSPVFPLENFIFDRSCIRTFIEQIAIPKEII